MMQNLFTIAAGALVILSTMFVEQVTAEVEVPECDIDPENCSTCLAMNGAYVPPCNGWFFCNQKQIEDACGSIANGDPHFKTWSGEKYDFHGVCDLVLLTSHEVNIHIRTKKMQIWSYIETASVQIGDDILEVKGGAKENKFWVNKVPGKSTSNIQLSNYNVKFTQLNNKSRQFVIDMGEKRGKITIKTWNAMVSVSLTFGSLFEKSRGLMGAYPDGRKVSRSSDITMADNNAFGMEWQVQRSEPHLFHTPSDVLGKCEVPSRSQLRRQLGQSAISKDEAEVACARVRKEDFDLCVFDVMATNDKESAGAY